MTTNPTEILLSRLEGVKETSAGQWKALCPAHDDHNPSLCVTEKDDRVLIHCYVGCAAAEIVEAVDLSLSDLFDKPLDHRGKPIPKRNRWDARALLKISLDESIMILIAARQVTRGEPLNAVDQKRLVQAVKRIAGIVEMVA